MSNLYPQIPQIPSAPPATAFGASLMTEIEDNEINRLNLNKLSKVAVLVGPEGDSETFIVDKEKFASTIVLKKLSDTNDRIILPDVTPRCFRIFLMFIDKVCFSFESVEEAIEACTFAHYYDVIQLKPICIPFIFSNLTPSNVCYIYYYIQKFDYPSFRCLKIFSLNTKDVIESEAFKHADKSTIEAIVKSEKLTLPLEVDLFRALVQWAELECIRRGDKPTKENHRSILEPMLSHIRFLAMSVKEFADFVVTSQILTQSEQYALIMNIINPNTNIIEIPNGFSPVKCSRVSEMLYLQLYRREKKDCGAIDSNNAFLTTVEVKSGAIQICRLYFPFTEKKFRQLSGTVSVKMKVIDTNNIIKYMSVFEENFITEGEDCYVHCHSATIKEGETVLISANVSGCTENIRVFKCTYYGNETVGSANISVVDEKEKTALNFKKISMFCKLPVYL